MALACKIEDQVYTIEGRDYTYNEFRALLYDGLMQKMAAEAEARGVAMPAEAEALAQEELDSIAEEAVELEDTGMVSLGEQAAEKVAESLASIGVTVEVLDNAEYLADARIPQEVRQRSQGVFVTDSGTVLLNRQRIQSQYGDVVAYHEGVHPILNIIRNTDKARYDALVMGIREEAKTNEALKQLIERVSNNPAYRDKGDIVLGDEILSETIGMIGSGEIQVKVLSRNLLQKIVDFFNSIAVALKLKKMSPQMAQREFAKTANDIANALKYGRSVVPIVGKKGIGLFQSATGKTMIYERAVDPAEVRARVVAGKPISTRNPTGKAKDIEGTEPDGTADLAAMRKDPKLYRTNAILMAEYPIVAASVPEVARYIRQLRKPLMDLQSLFDKTSTTLADLRDRVKSELIAQEKKEAQKAGKPLKGFKTKATTADVDLILEGSEVPYVITPKIQRLIDKIRPLQEKMKDLRERRKKALSDYKKVLESPAAVKKFGQKEADKVYEALIDGFKRNLQKLIDLFPKDLLDAASLWYDGANIIAQQFSKDYNTTLERASAVLAVFSPQKDWFMNVALAKRMMNVWVNHQDTVFDDAMEKRFLKRAGEPEPKTNKEGDVIVGEDGEIEYTKGAKPVFDEDGNLTGWIGWDNASYKEKYEEGLRLLEQMRGKKLKDLPTHLQARFIRMWSEVYDKPGFEIVSPDGNFGTNKLSDKGNEVKLAWGSYVTIEKAIRIMQASEANEMSVISDELGEQHKVRSFYNNIVDPANKGGHVTMDTHAIAAGLWMALSGGSLEVAQNFGGGGASSNINIGVKGTYAVNGEAYRRLSDELRAKGFDYLARQIQSITWEGVRLLFPAKFKSNYQNVAKVRAVWEQFQRREITIDQAHDRIYQIVDEWRNRATLKGRPGKTASDAIADGTGLGVRPDWASFTGSGADYTGGAQQADDAGRLPSVGRAGGTGLGRGAGGRGDVGQPSGVVSRSTEGQEQGPVLDVQASMIERGAKADEAFNGIEEPKTPIGDTKTVVVDGKERTVFNSEGRPIHPTVEGVRNFWRWFGDSKVVDAEGRPRVVYHGTPSGGFDEFDLSRTGSRDPGWVGRGFYFTTDRNTGIAYAQMGRGDNRQLYELYAKAENPFEWGPKDTGAYGLVMQGNPLPGFLQKAVYERTGYKFVPSERMSSQQIERTIAYISRAIRDELISRGYDSVITTYEDGGYELMTLDSAQLKSATGNYGTFNPASRNIQQSAIERPSKGMLAPGEWNSMVMPIRESLKANKDVDAIMQDLASQGLTEGFDQQKLDALRDRVTASHAKFNQLRGERAGAKPAGAAVPFRKTQKQREIEEEVQAAKPVKTVEVDEMKALKDQIRLEARAASEAVKNVAQKRKEFVAKVSVVAKGFVSGLLGKTIRPNALASIATLAARVDPTNEKQVEGFLKKLDDIIGKAERDKYYEERKTEANNLRKQIKKAAKSGFVKKRDYRLPALATQFASLRIPKAEDIGGYIEVAKALKDLLSGAKVQVTDELVKAINTDAGLTNKALSDYITSRLNSEQAEADQRLLEEFEKIRIENNLEGASLTLDDIKDIMRSLAADQKTIKAQNDKLVKEQKLKMLQTMSRIKLQELKRYRQDKALDKQDAEIVENILKIDAERLTATDAALLIAAINNIILNGSFSGLRTSFAAKGMKDAAMKELQEYAKKMGGFGQPGSEWGINKNTDQVAGLFEKIGKNPTVASILRTLTGFDGMLNSTARAAEMVRDIQEQRKQYAKKVGYKDTTLNRYRMGVYAYLIQNNGGTQEEMDAEFAQRAQDLRESKEMLSNRANYVLGSVEGRIDTALYIRAIDEVLGQAEMLEGVKIDPVLKKMVEWEIKKHGEYTAMHQDAADRDHNSGYGDVENYTAQSNITVKVDGPSQDSKAIQDFIDKQLTQAVFLPTRIKETPAGAKMQRRGKNASQVVDLNFFNVQDRSRKDNFADTFGAKYVALLREMLADDRLSGSDRLVDESTKEHLKAVAKSILGMDDIRTDALRTKSGKVYNYLSRSSAALALRGVIQIPKQMTPLVSTWFALNPFGKGSQYLTNGLRDATGALDKDSWQYGLIKDLQIAQRYSTMFGINKLGDQVTREAILSGDESKVYELLKRGFNGWSVTSNYLSKSISAPDAFTATASWFAFYRQYLDRSGIDLTKDDWKYQLDEQAAAYANQMVERAQNANTPESMPLVYKNKGIAWRAMMDLFYAFSSFNLNTRKRFNRDVQLLFSGSNEDKRFAGLDLVGMLAEQAAFVTVATASYEFTADMFSQLFGDDDEGRRRKKKMRDEDRSFTEKVIGNTLINFFLVGLPDIGNDYIKKFVNYLTWEPGKQNLFYVKEGMSLGTMGVIIDETANAIIAANALATGEINNEKISEEDETMLRIALLMSFFNLTRISDQTFTRATRREAMKRVPPSKEDAEDMIIHSIAAPFVDEEEREKRRRFEERKRRMMQR